MFSDVDGRREETGMIGCQMAMSCRGAMQRLEMCVDRRLWAGMVEQAVDISLWEDALAMWRTIALYKRLSSESVAIIVISVVLVVVSSVRQNSTLARRRRIKLES